MELLVYIVRQLAGAEFEWRELEAVNEEGFDDNLKEAAARDLAADAARTELVPRADRSIIIDSLKYLSQIFKQGQLKSWQMIEDGLLLS